MAVKVIKRNNRPNRRQGKAVNFGVFGFFPDCQTKNNDLRVQENTLDPAKLAWRVPDKLRIDQTQRDPGHGNRKCKMNPPLAGMMKNFSRMRRVYFISEFDMDNESDNYDEKHLADYCSKRSEIIQIIGKILHKREKLLR